MNKKGRKIKKRKLRIKVVLKILLFLGVFWLLNWYKNLGANPNSFTISNNNSLLFKFISILSYKNM